MALTLHCPDCDASSPLTKFDIADEHLEATCQACGRTVTVSTEGIAKTAARHHTSIPDGVESMDCPKCGLAQVEAEACRGCGLLAKLMDDFSAHLDDDLPEELTAQWAKCEQHWEDDEAHENFLKVVVASASFTYAARCYRMRDDDRSRGYLARLPKMAAATMSIAATRPKGTLEDPPMGAAVVLMIILLVLVLAGGIYALYRGSQVPADGPPRPHSYPTELK